MWARNGPNSNGPNTRAYSGVSDYTRKGVDSLALRRRRGLAVWTIAGRDAFPLVRQIELEAHMLVVASRVVGWEIDAEKRTVHRRCERELRECVCVSM